MAWLAANWQHISLPKLFQGGTPYLTFLLMHTTPRLTVYHPSWISLPYFLKTDELSRSPTFLSGRYSSRILSLQLYPTWRAKTLCLGTPQIDTHGLTNNMLRLVLHSLLSPKLTLLNGREMRMWRPFLKIQSLKLLLPFICLMYLSFRNSLIGEPTSLTCGTRILKARISTKMNLSFAPLVLRDRLSLIHTLVQHSSCCGGETEAYLNRLRRCSALPAVIENPLAWNTSHSFIGFNESFWISQPAHIYSFFSSQSLVRHECGVSVHGALSLRQMTIDD